jgi:hypothetical protein
LRQNRTDQIQPKTANVARRFHQKRTAALNSFAAFATFADLMVSVFYPAKNPIKAAWSAVKPALFGSFGAAEGKKVTRFMTDEGRFKAKEPWFSAKEVRFKTNRGWFATKEGWFAPE